MPKIGDKKDLTTGDGRKMTAVYTSSGWKYSAPFGPKKDKGGRRGGGSPNAAAAVATAVRNVGESVSSALDTVRLGRGRSSGSGSRPSSAEGTGGAVKPAKPAGKPKVGAVYAKTRSAYKSESANQPSRYETDEQRKARMDKSKFDWSMSADDVKKYRAAYLKKHPAAAKAVAKGTMSMGDINLTVRRLKKKGSMGAFGMKQENEG